MVWGLSDYGRCVFGSGTILIQERPLLPPSVTAAIIQGASAVLWALFGARDPLPVYALSLQQRLWRKFPMIHIGEIDHVVLRVIDMPAMQRFYCEVLGCREERRQDAIGLVQLRAGSSLIDLVSIDGKLGQLGGRAPSDEGHNMDHLCLRVDNYDESAILAHLKAHDVRIGELGLRYGARGMGPSIYLYDREGNRVELKGPVST